MKARALLSLCLLLAPAAVFPDELLYRSNSFGMLLERIAPYRRDESAWIMSVKRSGETEVRSLVDNGKEVRRWEASSSGGQTAERELDGGTLAARRVYDSSGALVQEEQYEAGSLKQKTLYTYAGTRLLRVRTLDRDAATLFTDEYVYATNGSLREVRRTGPAGSVGQSSVRAGGSGIFEERTVAGDTLLVARYDAQGRLTSRERRTGGVTVLREDLTFGRDKDLLVSSTEKRPAEGTTIDRVYDDAGRLARETTTGPSGGPTVDTWIRDGAGHVLSHVRRGPAGLEVWNDTLRADGSVSREEYTRRGSLEKVTIYGEGKLRTEELYREGALFLRAFFDGDTRLKEEVWSGGTLVRTRNYP